jgi:4-hydroxy-tetrahydrodipicolinate reductase
MRQPIRVAICGINGRMGREVRAGLSQDPEVTVVGGSARRAADGLSGFMGVPVVVTLEALLDRVPVDVVVDFTAAEPAARNAAVALTRATPIVIGTSGLTDTDLVTIDDLAREHSVGALVAPNFAIGANLLLQFARLASKFLGAAEIIETHHDAKIDAPSGTALMIAQAMRAARGEAFAGDQVTRHVVAGARGGVAADVHIHSLRLPGFVASHQVIFGGPGQSLTLRHDSIGRDSFVPGVIYAEKHIHGLVGLVFGLDKLMGFDEI